MEENEEACLCKTELFRNPKSLLSEIKGAEKQIQRKKRWLLGIVTTKSDRTHFKKLKFLKDIFLPESLLREDDIFYEAVRTYVEGLYGVCHTEGEFDVIQDDMLSVDMPSIKKLISCLDNMTTRGLYLLAEIIIGDLVKLKRTRGELKKIVKSFLSSALGNQNHDRDQLKLFEQLFELVKNRQHFQDNCKLISASRFQSSHAAVKKVLAGLEDFPCQNLNAMLRKLDREEATIPQLRTGRKRYRPQNDLIEKVRQISKKMLSKLNDGDELPEPLAKAMAVADLSLKLANHKDICSKFYQLAPKVKSLQDDIMKAICRVETVGMPVLCNLKLLVELKGEISNKLLRTAFKELLTEFLFECNDLDKIPNSLSDILDVINGSLGDKPLHSLQEEKIKEEVDGILNFSAQTKQLALDMLPNYGFDEDFADAYVEQLLESDADDYDDIQIGETSCFTNGNYDSSERELDENFGTRHVTNFLCVAVESEPTKNDMRRNQYLAIQDASDKTSMLTHKLIGSVLWEFAKLEGLHLNESQRLYLTGDNQIKDVKGKGKKSSSSKKDPRNSAIVRAVEKLVPSFSDSGAMERLKKVIG